MRVSFLLLTSLSSPPPLASPPLCPCPPCPTCVQALDAGTRAALARVILALADGSPVAIAEAMAGCGMGFVDASGGPPDMEQARLSPSPHLFSWKSET